MIIGRLIGWLALLAALAVEGRDLLGWFDTGFYRALSLIDLLVQLGYDGKPAIPALLQAPLKLPAAAALAVFGLVLIALFRRRTRRRRR